MANKRKMIDGVETSKFSREELEEFAYKLKEANDREREERNYFQTERDKFRTYWEITRSELETTKAALQNRDRQLEEADEKNAEELRFYRQKVKHLQYEHQNSLNDSQAETLIAFKKVQDQFTTQEKELLQDKRKLRGMLKEQELSGLDQIKAIKLQGSEEIGKARVQFEARAKELEIRYEKKFSDLIQHLTSKYEMEISEVEERKNGHISELIKHHEKSFNEMRNYYNDITLNNLTLISTLKDEMEKLRKINDRMTKQVSDLTAELKRLKIPLSKADETINDLKRQLVNYERDKITLSNTKVVLAQKDKECKDLRWSYDALELRFETLQKERDELHNRFVNAVLEVQQKTSKILHTYKKLMFRCIQIANYPIRSGFQ